MDGDEAIVEMTASQMMDSMLVKSNHVGDTIDNDAKEQNGDNITKRYCSHFSEVCRRHS